MVNSSDIPRNAIHASASPGDVVEVLFQTPDGMERFYFTEEGLVNPFGAAYPHTGTPTISLDGVVVEGDGREYHSGEEGFHLQSISLI